MKPQADELREAVAQSIADAAHNGEFPASLYMDEAGATMKTTALYLRANARSLAQHDDTAEAWVEKIIGLIEEAGRG